MKTLNLIKVFYRGGLIVGQPNDIHIATTDDFDLWIETHNKQREADGEEPENKSCFRTLITTISLFKKEPVPTAKVFFSENDLSDMEASFFKEEGQLWQTWMPSIVGTNEAINVELYLGENPDEVCKRCNGEMRIIDYSLQVNGGSDKYENEDGKMPCPTCEGNG